MAWSFFPVSSGDDIQDASVWAELDNAIDERAQASGATYTPLNPAVNDGFFTATNISSMQVGVKRCVDRAKFVNHTDNGGNWDGVIDANMPRDNDTSTPIWTWADGGSHDITLAANANVLNDGAGNAFTRYNLVTGLADVTNGNATITGTGTSWSSDLSVGDNIMVGSTFYTVSSIASNTELDLNTTYSGVTQPKTLLFKRFIGTALTDDALIITWMNEMFRVLDLLQWTAHDANDDNDRADFERNTASEGLNGADYQESYDNLVTFWNNNFAWETPSGAAPRSTIELETSPTVRGHNARAKYQVTASIPTVVSNDIDVYVYGANSSITEWDDDGIGYTADRWNNEETISANSSADPKSGYFGNSMTIQDAPSTLSDGEIRGWRLKGPARDAQFIVKWNFSQ